ncbi:hypothetical protein ACOMHN_032069 [Nucella lapillus]
MKHMTSTQRKHCRQKPRNDRRECPATSPQRPQKRPPGMSSHQPTETTETTAWNVQLPAHRPQKRPPGMSSYQPTDHSLH